MVLNFGAVRYYPAHAAQDGLLTKEDFARLATWDGLLVNNTARAHSNTAQSIANNTLTALLFELEGWDTDTMHSTSANTSRITFKSAGKSVIVGFFQFDLAAAAGTGSVFAAVLRLNGGVEFGRHRQFAQSYPAFSIAGLVDHAVNDYVELCAYHNNGAAINTLVGGPFPSLAVVRVR